VAVTRLGMPLVSSILLAGVLVSACGGKAPAPAGAEAPEPEPLSVTRWTDTTELFAEYPTLVVGETSRFAIHLTRLDTFKPLLDGRVEVRLEADGVTPEVFVTDAPSRPGIFGVDVKPTRSGTRTLVITVKARGLGDLHRVDGVTVHPDVAAAKAIAAEPEGATGISFLKEQQWSLDFGTAVVAAGAVRDSIRVPARVTARPGGAADVLAPIDGRLIASENAPLGGAVTKGQVLARIQPSASASTDVPQLQRARSEAQSVLGLVTRDRERAERLTQAGAAPAKRLDEARAAEEQAKARLSAAETSVMQFTAARTGAAVDAGNAWVVRSPLTGVIAQRDATAGANVPAGTLLFRVVDVGQLHVVGEVPEAEVPRARLTQAGEIDVPGEAGRVAVGPPVSLGGVLDPATRTLAVTFAFDNRVKRLAVGQSTSLYLLLAETAPKPVVPAAAIVDDAGRPIVFVQREGETFERRAVTLGARNGDQVQIVDGIAAGDRVVTAGAYLVRLASLSTSVPAHGHVH
jgi:cobalt-zinc-cadmium efflux system membrane fusion protein